MSEHIRSRVRTSEHSTGRSHLEEAVWGDGSSFACRQGELTKASTIENFGKITRAI